MNIEIPKPAVEEVRQPLDAADHRQNLYDNAVDAFERKMDNAVAAFSPDESTSVGTVIVGGMLAFAAIGVVIVLIIASFQS